MSIVSRQDDSDYSPTWKWVDEEELAGAHVEFRRASTDNGDKIVWEIESDEHGRVSVWLDPTNLQAKVRGELARRKAKHGEPRLEDGERVRLNPEPSAPRSGRRGRRYGRSRSSSSSTACRTWPPRSSCSPASRRTGATSSRRPSR